MAGALKALVGAMHFCIRDDDTSFFTAPDQLDKAYDEICRWGPVSLAVVPFHRAGTSKAVPEKYRGRWSIHPLHENHALVGYLRSRISKGHFEIMLHGYHHDEPTGRGEFLHAKQLVKKVMDGRRYLEDLLGAPIRVFVAPKNTIGRRGLRAVAGAGLHLGGTAGVRAGWSPFSQATWRTWFKLLKWRQNGGSGVPWILNLGDHYEIPGNAITPASSFERNKAAYDNALRVAGVFCAATHYWELTNPSLNVGDPTVGEHLRYLIDRARSDPRVVWRSVGDIVSNCTRGS
jgi:Uncharacterized protein conserved in bacteria (DUF2334)